MTLWSLSRTFGLGLVLVMSCGCSSIGGDARLIYEMAKQQWSGPTKISLSTAAATPYASMAIRLGDGDESMLILATAENTKYLWTSASHITLVTVSGRITRTAGLADDLGSLTPTQNYGGEESSRTYWIADFPAHNLYNISITCRRVDVGSDKVSILGKLLPTRRLEEYCRSESKNLIWNFKNTYWADEAGFVWRSIQHTSPNLNPIEFNILRPPS